MSTTEQQPKPTYLGDGVYASYDGYHLWLAANHHENKVIALEPEVFKSLIEYANQIPNFQS